MTNQDIYSFVNSKDIRKHLMNINYRFNTLEAAWLIYQCRGASVKEKWCAWEDIMRTMADQPVESLHFKTSYASLHQMIQKYIDLQKTILRKFEEKEPGAFYQYLCIYENSNIAIENFDNSDAYSSPDECRREMCKELSEDDAIRGVLRRIVIDNPSETIRINYHTTGEAASISVPIDYGSYDWNVYDFFDCLWFHFPVPFREGDILYDPFHPKRLHAGPLVMTGVTPLEYEKNKRAHADYSDMNVWGYFQDEDTGIVYSEITWNYMDFEYYPEEKLTKKKRILKALSNYMKGEIGIDLYTLAYHQILTEESRSVFSPFDHYYTDEGLMLASLKEEP